MEIIINQFKALNNLIVLSREDAGCDEIIINGGIKELIGIMNNDISDHDTVLSVTRIISSLCKNSFKRVRFCCFSLYNEKISIYIKLNHFSRPKKCLMKFSKIRLLI